MPSAFTCSFKSVLLSVRTVLHGICSKKNFLRNILHYEVQNEHVGLSITYEHTSPCSRRNLGSTETCGGTWSCFLSGTPSCNSPCMQLKSIL